MVSRYIVCERGTLVFDIGSFGVTAYLKQGRKITPLRISQSSNVCIEDWISAYTSGLNLGCIQDDFLHIKLGIFHDAWFKVHKSDFAGVVFIEYSITGRVISSRWLYCDYTDLQSGIDLCQSIWNYEHDRHGMHLMALSSYVGGYH